MKKWFLLLCLMAGCPSVVGAPLWSAKQALSLPTIESTAVSSDGQSVAYVVSQMISGRWISHLLLSGLSHHTQVIASVGNGVAAPAFSLDNQNIFYLDQGNCFQSLWVYHLKTRTKEKIIELSSDIFSFRISPDGQWIALASEDQSLVTKAKPRLLPFGKNKINVRLYLIQAPFQNASSKKIVTLTPSSQSILFNQDYTWSPDSRTIAYAYRSLPGYICPMDSRVALINIFTRQNTSLNDPLYPVMFRPIFSLDGKWLAFGTTLPQRDKASMLSQDVNENSRVCVFDLETKKIRCLANTPNENAMPLSFDRRNHFIYVLDSFKTEGPQIYAIPLSASGSVKRLTQTNGYIDPETIFINGQKNIISFVYETVTRPQEVYIANAPNFKLKQISQVQPTHLPLLGHVRLIHWRAPDGARLEALLITPPHYDAKKPYPLLVALHGGPNEYWSRHYLGEIFHREKLYAPYCLADYLSRGFIVFEPNPRGSGGYGENFRLALFKEIGHLDYEDVMSGVDYLVQHKLADSHRLALWGWSFGGYLAAWTVTQTHRFERAMEGSGYTDLISYAGVTDIPKLLVEYLGEPFWENRDLYLARSPILFVQNIKTPLLIIGGDQDTRIPLSQGQELYTALREQHKPVSFYVMKGEAHLPTNPNTILETLQTSESFLSQVLGDS